MTAAFAPQRKRSQPWLRYEADQERSEWFASMSRLYRRCFGGFFPTGLEQFLSSPDRFARDLRVQLAGHDMLKAKGINLIAASAQRFFVEDTPTAVLVRQVLGAVAQFEKATTVAKLAAARRRKRATTGQKVESRKKPGRDAPRGRCSSEAASA